MSFTPYDVLAPGRGPLLLTCEHATNRLPPGYAWPAEDRWLTGTHWAFDLGIGEMTCMLAERLGLTAVLCGFSRLVVDPNRTDTDLTLFRRTADGREIGLNRHIDAEEAARRMALYHAYHAAIDRALVETPGHGVLSMHSFTPQYEDEPPRPMEVGVLFDRDEEIAHRLGAAIARSGLKVALNEPYSGKGGLMYCVELHAGAAGRVALELEVRQDLADDPIQRRRLVPAIASALLEVGLVDRNGEG